jgi:hypothetical protein
VFALPEYDDAFTRFTWEVVDALARARNPLLAELGAPVRDSTTVASRVQSRDGVDLDLPGTTIAVEFTTEVAAVRAGDAEAYAQQLDAAAEQLERSLMEHLFDTMRKLTAATGMVTDATGRPTFEAIYEMLDRKEWSLTEDDQLAMPTIVGGSAVRNLFSTLTEEQQGRLDDLLRRKYEELIARKRRRRLS